MIGSCGSNTARPLAFLLVRSGKYPPVACVQIKQVGLSERRPLNWIIPRVTCSATAMRVERRSSASRWPREHAQPRSVSREPVSGPPFVSSAFRRRTTLAARKPLDVGGILLLNRRAPCRTDCTLSRGRAALAARGTADASTRVLRTCGRRRPSAGLAPSMRSCPGRHLASCRS